MSCCSRCEKGLIVTAYGQAERFVGLSEIAGELHNPQILAMLKLDQNWPQDDETPWCSAFANYIAWWLRLPRSKSLLARSWLLVGRHISLKNTKIGFDVVILSRGQDPPKADVINAPGHVGFYGGRDEERVYMIGGNQKDSVNLSGYPISRILGVRRLWG